MINNVINYSDIAMFKEYPDVVTVEQLQKMIGVGKNTAYKLLKDNSIRYIKIGSSYKIPKICVISYLMQVEGGVCL